MGGYKGEWKTKWKPLVFGVFVSLNPRPLMMPLDPKHVKSAWQAKKPQRTGKRAITASARLLGAACQWIRPEDIVAIVGSCAQDFSRGW